MNATKLKDLMGSMDQRMKARGLQHAVDQGWLVQEAIGNSKIFSLGEESPDYTVLGKAWGDEVS